jgi:hypothetical protein
VLVKQNNTEGNTIKTVQTVNTLQTETTKFKSNPKIKTKNLSIQNEPEKKNMSTKNCYRLNFFSPQSGKLKKMQNLTERSNTSIRQTPFLSIIKLSNSKNVITEASIPKAAGSNQVKKVFSNVVSNNTINKNSNYLNPKNIKVVQTKPLTSKPTEDKLKSKFINVKYTNLSTNLSNLNSSKPKDTTNVNLNYKPFKKSYAERIINSADLSIESRQQMIKKKSHNTFISHNQVNQSKREIQQEIKNQELKKNATFDYLASDSVTSPYENNTEYSIKSLKSGFINNKYKFLIDQYFNETRDKLISIQIQI